VRYLFHGYMVEAKKLTVRDKEGVDWDCDTGSIDGAFYIRTTVGRENFVPGDYLVSTLDGASVRIRPAKDFLPFAQEVLSEPVQEAGRINGTGVGVNVSGQGISGDSDAGVRVPDGKAETLGEAGKLRRRRTAQRSDGNTRRDARSSVSRAKESRKANIRHRIRKGR